MKMSVVASHLPSRTRAKECWTGDAGLKIVLAAIAIGMFLSACGGGGPVIDARVLQLHLTYSISGPTEAILRGDTGAAAAGADVECRLTTSGRPVLGTATASETGSFDMELDLQLLPQQLPDNDTFRRLNETVECRSGSGAWEHPLRQPVLRIE